MEIEDAAQVNPGANMPPLETGLFAMYQFDDEEEQIFMEMADENEAPHLPLSQEEEANTGRRLVQPIDLSGGVENTRDTTQEKQTTSKDHSRSQSWQTSSQTNNHTGVAMHQLPSNNDLHGYAEDHQTNIQTEHASQSPLATLHSNKPEFSFMNKLDTGAHRIPRQGGSDNTVESTIEDNPAAISFFTSSQDKFRISKRSRLLPGSIHETRPTPVPIRGDTSYLTEDTLFQLLMSRNKKREEEAIWAANAQKELETAVAKLAEENKILRDEIKLYDARFQKTSLESNLYKSQMADWKSKFGEFRGFLNSLGVEFQTLRGESINMKAIECALNREGNELRTNIEDMKARVFRVTSALYQKGSHRVEYEGIISTLRHKLEKSLRAEHDKTEVMRHSLCELHKTLEKTKERAMRSASEVVYLQNKAQEAESRVQEELSRASVILRNQSNARYEQQLHDILREKATLENELSATKDLFAHAHKVKSNDHMPPENLHKHQKSLVQLRDQEIEALQSRINEDTSKYNAQDMEIKRLKEAEIFNTTERNQLEQQLEDLNQHVVSLKAKISSHDMDCEQLRRHQKDHDWFQGEVSQKENGLISTREDLNVANMEISALKNGKAKTKGEIHTLLLRLQESERWIKNMRGNLESLRASVPTEPLGETCDKLEKLLRQTTFGDSPKTTKKEIPEETVMTPNSRTMAAGSFQTFPSREPTYRTQNTQEVKCSSSGEDTEEFERIFSELCASPDYHTPVGYPKTSQNLSGKRERSILSNPARGNSANKRSFPRALGKLTSQSNAADCQGSDDYNNNQEAVTFESQSTVDVEVGGKAADITPKAQERHDRCLSGEKKLLRSAQPTYSKTRQLSMSHRTKRNNHNENTDQMQSPRSIASASGRKKSAREDTKKKWAARGQKRPGRKTRGERYNTRFSQPASDSHCSFV